MRCRKKKKNKAKEFLETVEKSEEKVSESSKSKVKKTPAELAFKKIQDKRVRTVFSINIRQL